MREVEMEREREAGAEAEGEGRGRESAEGEREGGRQRARLLPAREWLLPGCRESGQEHIGRGDAPAWSTPSSRSACRPPSSPSSKHRQRAAIPATDSSEQ
eukprot:scaffold76555_cov37-Tisochrysis_lutea.AAC.1